MNTGVRWRRLDLPGSDEAHLLPVADGYTLAGLTRFRDEDGPVSLSYLVDIDAHWGTRSAVVIGTVPAGPCRIDVKAGPHGTWSFNGNPAPSVAGCIDFDLGFTPATNILSIRRLALPVGASQEVPVAWLPSLRATTLEPLRQVYHRVAEDRYRYSCPDLPFDSTLRVNADGFVLDYPPLWEEQAEPGQGGHDA